MTFALWVSTHPETCWAIGCLVWLALIAVAALKGGPTRIKVWQSHIAFAGVAVAVLIVNRWPIFFNPSALNPDEAQMAAQAIKSLSDPLPWHGFDGTTSGPLNSYFLTFPRLFGIPITMQSTHILAAALELGTIFALQSAATKIFGTTIGRCSALILLTFYAFAQDFNFVHYSSEHLPIFLLACSLSTLADAYGKARPRLASCAIGGFVLGLAPFAKLQSLLFAGYIGAAIVLALATRSASPGEKRRELGWFIAGGIGAVGLLIALTAAGGSLHDALVSYILSNAAYSRNITSLGPRFFLFIDPMYSTFTLSLISLIFLLGGMAIWSKPDRYFTQIIMFLGGLMLVGIWTVRLANHAFAHYLVFTIFPMTALVAALAGTVYGHWRGRSETQPGIGDSGRERAAPTFVYVFIVSVAIVPSLLQQLVVGNAFTHDAPAYIAYRDRLGSALRHIIPAQARVAVWGWMPQYYVDTQTIMATKDGHTYAQIVPGPYRDYFRARYMNEMQQNPPSYFVDSVAPGSFGFTDRATAGMESFPQLAQFILHDYKLVAEISGVRIYRRKIS